MAIFHFLALATLVTLASASADGLVNQETSASNLDAEFLNNEFAYFQTRYGKKYGHADEVARRRAIFEQNMKKINDHNNGANANGKTWFMAANEFTDLTSEEFAARVGLSKVMPANGRTRPVMTDIKSSEALPAEVDWTKEKAVSPVKNQGHCASFWSFSAAGAIEGAWALKTGQLVSLSTQELIDCDKSYENALRTAVSERPVAVVVDADEFQFYSHGILNSCAKNRSPNHALLAVGYSIKDKYYKLKNSWGPYWGDDGYIRIASGNEEYGGECGVMLMASYPTIAA